VETNAKAILSVALVLGGWGLAAAAQEKSDPVGKWNCEYEIAGQNRMATLIIRKDGDKLVGTMSWPDRKETPVKDLKLKDLGGQGSCVGASLDAPCTCLAT
jgi:hypothetical protein